MSLRSVDEYLKFHQLEFLSPHLSSLGINEPNDFVYLTDDLIDKIALVAKLPIIQRKKFEKLIEIQKDDEEMANSARKTANMIEVYSSTVNAMQSLIHTGQITQSEFEEWRREEFRKYFSLVNQYFIIIIIDFCLFQLL